MEPQITGETVGEVRPVADMHQRKAEMARHSDCFIALPGPTLSIYLSLSLSKLSLNPNLLLGNFNGIFSVIFFRWVWNFGGVTRSDHMGSTWYP